MRKRLKGFLAASSLAALLFTTSVPADAAFQLPFKDVSGQYSNGVGYLYTSAYILGTSATTFGTTDHIKRGDTAVIIARVLHEDTLYPIDAGFTDAGRYAPFVNALYMEGIIHGVSSTEFNPDGTLTRGAMAKILVEAYDIPAAEKKSPFKDAAGVFGPYIQALYEAGITSGKTPDTFGTYGEITRGEFAVLLYKTMQKFGHVNTPELAVQGADIIISNIKNHTISVKAAEGSDIKVTVGNKVVAANEEGKYDITLIEGPNTITVTATRFGLTTTFTRTAILDTTPPSLIGPELPDVVYDPTLTLDFEAEGGAGVRVTLNGVLVYYPRTITLQEGPNTIVITITDTPGNKTIFEKIVTYVK